MGLFQPVYGVVEWYLWKSETYKNMQQYSAGNLQSYLESLN